MAVHTLSPVVRPETQAPIVPGAAASRLRPRGIPRLSPGDHLTRAEFERRYEAAPQINKAELIEGVVYMPSPTRAEQHSRPHGDVVTWLNIYRTATPNTWVGDNPTVRLDYENEVQPDAILRLSVGGRCSLTEDDYLSGPPELIVEVAASSAAYDLHIKRRVYQRSGVQEYLALQVYEQRADWWILREGVYQPLGADAERVLRSETFPGLWLNAPAFWAGDLAAVLATLQTGLATHEHAAFAASLIEQKAQE
ncbi:MAG: Uma2 family endonuclease [Chloroflexi bacterium]|nr:Uma2 family endonuclease [Chloroflexota bacterium]